MNHHLEAWEHVKKHIFGTDVVEVTTKPNWGFKEDMSSINNLTIDEFLSQDIQADTIILHILSGEGTDKSTIQRVMDKAYKSCVKLIILEHNPDEWDLPDIDYMRQYPDFIEINWGRNLLIATTTLFPLSIPQLSNEYTHEHLNSSYINPQDEGIDKKHLVYTHTSESPIDFELPSGRIWWVIGGGLAYESMHSQNTNILFDSILKQCLYCAYIYSDICGIDMWKLKRIYPVDEIEVSDNYRQWRVVIPNKVKPNLIIHRPIQDIQTNDLVYVSTVDKTYWQHLPNVIDAFTDRDKPKLVYGENTKIHN